MRAGRRSSISSQSGASFCSWASPPISSSRPSLLVQKYLSYGYRSTNTDARCCGTGRGEVGDRAPHTHGQGALNKLVSATSITYDYQLLVQEALAEERATTSTQPAPSTAWPCHTQAAEAQEPEAQEKLKSRLDIRLPSHTYHNLSA